MESHRSTVPMAWSTKPPSVSTSQRQRTGDGKANNPIFFTDDDSDNSEDGKGLDNDTAEASIFKEYLGIHGESNADVDLSKIKNLLAASKSGAVSCLICLERVRSIDPVWDCKVGCHAVFHLICIQEWARQASNAAAERSIARLSRDHFPAAASAALENSCWHCPKCRVDYTQSQIPREYRCYCGKVVDPANDPWGTPHTCGEICGRPLPGNCEHECVLLCHPGPCPPCPKLARSKCFCGASSEVRRCGLKDFSCNGRCSKQLSCGLHKCEEKCHRGPCPPCRKNGLYRCLCGKAEKECLCSESEFQCENPCNQELGCRKHRCLKGCHSGPCGECELQGRRTCPCGKVEYRGLSCDDAVPTCGSTCEKMLHCSMHRCPERCHPGPCVDTCRTVTSKSCRCGSLRKQVPCHQDLVCDRKCQRVRDCGRHACKRRCCDGDCPPCSEICGRKLRCNNHKCPAPCHRGTCAPCPVTVRIACSCGETAFEVPCGTEKEQRPPRCSRQCSITPLCRHGPQSKEFRQIGNRENDGVAMLQLYEQLNVDERVVLRQCGLERAAGTRQVMMDRDMLSELVSWWDPERHVFILQQVGALPLKAIDIRRIMGLSDTGSCARLDSLRATGGTKTEAAIFLTGDRRTHVPSHGVRVRDILAAIEGRRIPRVRGAIALTLLYRVSLSSNWYNVPCGWSDVIQRCEQGERFDWCSLVQANMVMKLDDLRRTRGGDFTYCSILMGWVFDHFPRTAPIRREPLGPNEPTLRQWVDRHRHGFHGIRNRTVRAISLAQMRVQDFIADPYNEMHWDSDACYFDDDDGEEAPRVADEELEQSDASARQRMHRRRAMDSAEQVEPESGMEFRCTSTQIRRRLQMYFPNIRRRQPRDRRTPSPEEEAIWVEAEIARDVLTEQDCEIAELRARISSQEQVIASQREMIRTQKRCMDALLCHGGHERSPSRTRSRTHTHGSGTREMSINNTPQQVREELAGATGAVGEVGKMEIGESSRRKGGESSCK